MVILDVKSLSTNVSLDQTINIIIKTIYGNVKLIGIERNIAIMY